MNKNLVLLMFVFSGYSYCSAFKNTFKKLWGKRISSTYKNLGDFNLFQCFNFCEKIKTAKYSTTTLYVIYANSRINQLTIICI